MMPMGFGMPGMMPGMVSPTMAMMPGMQPAPGQPPPPPPPEPEPPKPKKREEKKKVLPMDPEVKELCDHFEISPECSTRLNEEMAKRQDSKPADLARLYELLEDVGSPTCLLELKIEEMQVGEFVGKVVSTREVQALALNFGLGEEATGKLDEMVSRRATRKGEDLVRMEMILEHSRDRNDTVVDYVDQILSGEVKALPDLSEAEDVIKKFKFDKDAQSKLIEVVLARLEDSSRILGRLEVYLELCSKPSAAFAALSGRLLAGGDVPDEPREENDRERDRSDRDRKRSPARRQRSRSRGRHSPPRRSSPQYSRGHRSSPRGRR
uniref:Uncharacterized protein n=1 Tax=Alexandrium catenella TaxID=2925 RepID=A0A7S1S5B0_ALECA